MLGFFSIHLTVTGLKNIVRYAGVFVIYRGSLCQ